MNKRVSDLERNNSLFIKTHIAYQVIILVAYLAEGFKGSRTWGYIGALAAIIAVTIVTELNIFKKDPESVLLRHIVSCLYAIMYSYVLFTAHNPLVFTYGLIMMVLITLFNDKKYTIIQSVGLILINVISAGIVLSKGGYGDLSNQTMPMLEIQVLLVILYSIYTYLVAKTSAENNADKVADIEAEKAASDAMVKTIVETVGDMNKAIGEISQSVETLTESSEETKSAMEEVSSGTTETANSVQEQLEMTEAIQDSVNEVKNASTTISQRMQEASDAIDEGRDNINLLLQKVAASETAGNKVVSELEELNTHTAQMHEIVEMITSIASQTTLLSLNASIEAARAGEAGRGFAVVADEISKLADQTSQSTSDITKLIDNLSAKLKEVVQSINQLMDSNREQNDCANSAASNFEQITGSAEAANSEAGTLAQVVSKLEDANSTIVNSIQTVSAISEEVSAHASGTLASSEKNAEIVNDVSRIIETLTADAKRLEEARR